METQKRKFLGWQADEGEIALAESLKARTREKTVSDVLRKALVHYAEANGVPA